ncbi:MAG: hypothetical protein KIT19_10785 [Phycisphaeraceae bacterium]|nr:hypothetical protein [Phycisphaeraceae bacterium]
MRIALLSSSRCPGTVIVHGLDVAIALKNAPITVASGFQSPMEKESLKFLLKGSVRLVACPARSAVGMRIPADWKKPMAEGRLTIRSFIDEGHIAGGEQRPITAAAETSTRRSSLPTRPTTDLAEHRNRFACSISDAVLILHASSGGKIERLTCNLLAAGKPVWTLDDPANASLVRVGAVPLTPATIEGVMGLVHPSRK